MAWRRSVLPIGLIAGAAAFALACMLAPRSKDVLLYNSSASVPEGLYRRVNGAPSLGAFVTVRAGDVAPAYAALRGFTDSDDRFIKRVAGVTGDQICSRSGWITINGAPAAQLQAHDGAGRTLPSWSGCLILEDEVFLLGDGSDSFDSRYWGAVGAERIEGVWTRLLD